MFGLLLLLVLSACKPAGNDPIAADTTSYPIEPYDPLELVDPFIGTGGVVAEIAAINPGASAPFGFTLVGPDTSGNLGDVSFLHFAGYHWDDDRIDAISHTHAHGMGTVDYCTVGVLPRASWRDAYTTDEGRAAPFTHEQEWARPGSYGVTLQDDGTEIEVVATQRGAHHRYTFADTSAPVVVIDLGHVVADETVSEANLSIDLRRGEVTGFQRMQGSYSKRFGGLQTHFAMVFDPAPIASGAWDQPDAPVVDGLSSSGPASGAWLVFPAGTKTVDLRVALSYADADGAWSNLRQELPDTRLQDRRESVDLAWTDYLSRVRVRGGSQVERRIFHTAMYHTALMPSRIDDVDGRYRGLDGELHAGSAPYYTDFSMWDTFRTLHPWYVLAQPEIQQQMLVAIEQMARDGGSVPRWPLGHGYTGGMVGTPADQIFAGSWLKGLRGFDAEWVFDQSFLHATGPVAEASRGGIEHYISDGYVAMEDTSSSASRTLEFAWNDAALALWAEGLGRDDQATQLRAQSQSWKNVWDPNQGFFTARSADGSFLDLEDPLFWNEQAFTEGNAYHYRWFVPFDVPGMVEVQHGGDVDAFEALLRDYWAQVYVEPDDTLPDDLYWHGNEPDIHYAFLGSMAGRPDVSAEASRWIAANRYFDLPRGLDGNDDGGTLSAWYLFAASGIFPIAGTPDYVLGSPIFERIEIDNPAGMVVIRAPRVSPQARYISRATLGDTRLTTPGFSHQQLLDAGELVLEMSTLPGHWDQ